MKYIISLLIVLGLGLVLSAFTPNDKSETVIYSCDYEVNKLITDNLDLVKEFSRERAVKYKDETMKAIFRTWDKEKQEQVFKDKLAKDSEHFDGEQKAFILNTVPELIQKNEAIRLFGSKLSAAIFTNLRTLDEQANTDELLLAYQPPGDPLESCDGCTGEGSAGGGGTGVPECECSTADDWCGGYCWGTNQCSVVFSSCGWWWNYDCNGICQ